ncbi:hypothetical protein C2857_007793 [Epichloe festucae Fl1]|uniref:Uncharacterized protein n=1 Tax=Epichloe festucae (strain Fl1) TaxID=877507 RepID=A0A7S9KR06_EPIFF|nr:hypothetical protein C2857_007793 [Epichloe festucae Fl1]
MSATVAIIGTCDTKLEELTFLAHEIAAFGNVNTCLIDVGRRTSPPSEEEGIDVRASDMMSQYRPGLDISELSSRGDFVEAMGKCAAEAVRDMYARGEIDAIVSAGGSGGTWLSSLVMRRLPIGVPKLIVSTVASGDTGPIVGESDMALMYSVVDIAGLNHLLRAILSNAAASIAGAALSHARRRRGQASPQPPPPPPPRGTVAEAAKKRVALTMFGVTTPGVDVVRKTLESRYPVETYVFHATGHGGRAMERLVASGDLDAVIDLTTTEICDHIMGGVMSAGPGRLDAAVEAGIPTIVSTGALDMANFGAKESVPERYRHRTQVEHNPVVTLVRSSPRDCRDIGRFICDKLRKAARPDRIQVWLPLGGASMLSVPGGPFHDADSDAALYESIMEGLEGTDISIVQDEGCINDRDFAVKIAEAMAKLMGLQESGQVIKTQ